MTTSNALLRICGGTLICCLAVMLVVGQQLLSASPRHQYSDLQSGDVARALYERGEVEDLTRLYPDHVSQVTHQIRTHQLRSQSLAQAVAAMLVKTPQSRDLRLIEAYLERPYGSRNDLYASIKDIDPQAELYTKIRIPTP